MFFPLNIFCQSFNFSESDFTDVDKVSKSCIVLFAETKLYFSPLTLFVSFLAILTDHMIREAGDSVLSSGLAHVPRPPPGLRLLVKSQNVAVVVLSIITSCKWNELTRQSKVTSELTKHDDLIVKTEARQHGGYRQPPRLPPDAGGHQLSGGQVSEISPDPASDQQHLAQCCHE